ncbi:MAG: YceI family protein [Saprospiraceae bacterium]|nr:YceI family protein [Saprospiraceae bacterium]
MKVKMLFLFVLAAQVALGQSTFRISTFTLTIKGTSNLHDWESQAKEMRASGAFTVDAGVLQAISSLSVDIPVKSIKSAKGSIMDNKTYSALKANKYATITFKLDKATVTRKGDRYDVSASGQLSIAGVTNKVSLAVQGRTAADGTLSFNGSYKLKMTDYGIDPPTALLGTMTTGDEVEIVFKITLKPE